MKRGKGWKNESERHGLARNGIRTRQELRQYSLGSKLQKEWKLLLYPQYWTTEYFTGSEIKELWIKHENELRKMAKEELKRMGNEGDWLINKDVLNHLVILASKLNRVPKFVGPISSN